MGDPPKIWPLSKSLKVTETHTDRSATYNFLIVIQWTYSVPFPR